MQALRTDVGCHEPVVSIHDLHFSYDRKTVLKDVNFTVLQRDFVGLIGPNGAGKTTLLRMIVGLLKPDRGEIRLFGQPIGQFKDWNKIGYVPQRSAINTLFPATVKEVVMSGLYGRGAMFRRFGRAEQIQCEEAMEALGIEHLHNRLIGKLSGGQQQRALLARALIRNPELLILDEPTVGIDAETQEAFFHMIRHMHRHHNITFLMVSHDLPQWTAWLGDVPVYRNGGLEFYVRHSHDADVCSENNWTHTLRQLRAQERAGAFDRPMDAQSPGEPADSETSTNSKEPTHSKEPANLREGAAGLPDEQANLEGTANTEEPADLQQGTSNSPKEPANPPDESEEPDTQNPRKRPESPVYN